MSTRKGPTLGGGEDGYVNGLGEGELDSRQVDDRLESPEPQDDSQPVDAEGTQLIREWKWKMFRDGNTAQAGHVEGGRRTARSHPVWQIASLTSAETCKITVLLPSVFSRLAGIRLAFGRG